MFRGKFLRSSFVGLVIVLVAALAAPAQGAKDGGSLDELRASDQEIVKAIADLDAQIAAQQNEVAAANQAYDAAMQAMAQIDADLKTATDRLEIIRNSVRGRALEEYMAPKDDEMSQLLNADGFGEASRRNELLRQMSDEDSNALDELRALKKDIDQQRSAAEQARKLAEKRKADSQKKLDELNAARAEKAKAEKVLKDRISAAVGEDEASSGFTGSEPGAISASGVSWPVRGNRPVTSGFGSRWGRLHAGIDVGIPVGTPLFAAKEGTVSWAGPASGYGNYICIASEGNLMTCYGHLSKINVKVGAKVTSSTEIGKSGNTGTSSGAHLHFETCAGNGKPACYYDKAYKNPMSYLPK